MAFEFQWRDTRPKHKSSTNLQSFQSVSMESKATGQVGMHMLWKDWPVGLKPPDLQALAQCLHPQMQASPNSLQSPRVEELTVALLPPLLQCGYLSFRSYVSTDKNWIVTLSSTSMLSLQPLRSALSAHDRCYVCRTKIYRPSKLSAWSKLWQSCFTVILTLNWGDWSSRQPRGYGHEGNTSGWWCAWLSPARTAMRPPREAERSRKLTESISRDKRPMTPYVIANLTPADTSASQLLVMRTSLSATKWILALSTQKCLFSNQE